MLEDYTEVLNTGKQLVVGLSRVPEGKYKTPDGSPASCRIDIYKVLDPMRSKDDFVYHIEHVGFAGAVLPPWIIDSLNHHPPSNHLGSTKKPLIQMYKAPKTGWHPKFDNTGPADSIVKMYKLLMQPNPKSGDLHMTHADDLNIALDKPEDTTSIINQIRAGINSLL